MCDNEGKPPGTGPVDCDKFSDTPKTDPCRKPGPVPGSKVLPPGSEGGSNMKGILEFPWILRIIGPKHIAIARLWVPTAAYYTFATLLATLYFCDWKAVLQYVPFWNGKYRKAMEAEAEAAAAAFARQNMKLVREEVEEKDPRCP